MEYENQYWIKNKLGEGYFGKVFALSQDKVAKVVSWIGDYPLLEEYQIQKQLWEGGINVSEPFGVHEISLNGKLARFFGIKNKQKAFVMERLQGVNLMQVENFSARNFYQEKYLEQIEKVESLGFVPRDTGIHNAFVDDYLNKVYLIDFHLWERK
jgi:hypothetical protein